MAVSISHLSFEHHRPAFGIAETKPRISWRFEGTAVNWEQTSYDLEITRGSDGVPNVFNVNSSDSILVPWPDDPLQTAESASVRARAHGKDGQPSADWSEVFSVETGLLSIEDWGGAVPIAADRDTEVNATHRPILFRKTFDVNSTVASARLYITAFGLYVAEINGNRVGDHVLAPGYHSYNNRLVYDTYDVTELVTNGGNAIGVTVGEGWYAGRFGFAKKTRNLYGDTIGLQSLLVVTSKDGSKQAVKSDLTWHANTGPIVTSELYNGEVYNTTEEIKGWSSPGLNESGWLAVKELSTSTGPLVPADGAPVKRIEELKPKELFSSDSGKTVIDFGQNLVGWLRLKVSGPAGTNITLVHTEVMENGEVSTRPLRTAKATDTLILSGNGTQTWEPSFTFHGFRYVQVSGWPNETALDGDSITAIVVHSDMERTGYFESSNSLLNKFHENVVWSMKGNFLGVPTDCPQRDERLGWAGDAHAFMPTSNYLYSSAGFWRGWLKDASFETMRNDHFVTPYYIPSDDIADTERNRQMLEEQFPAAQAWIDKGIPRNEAGLWDRSTFQFADWLDPKAPAQKPGNATTNQHLVSDAYLIQMTLFLSHLSAALNKPDLATDYATQHTTLIQAFQDTWITPYPIIANVTQTALALALNFNLYTNGTTRAVAASTLRSVIANNTYLVGTGFAGTQQLGFALTGINATADFYKMLLQTTVPSWLYQVAMGGTTTWERWDSMLPNHTVNPGTMTSFNHYAFGSVADWIHQKVGGLGIGEPGWKTVVVAPEPGGGVGWAKAGYLGPFGWVSSSWVVDGRGLVLEVGVPPNCRAEVRLPGREGVVRVGSGMWSFRVEGYRVPM
ncbi:hypothetical protein P280DRAFT_439794 [Massarina eburnea CBS 473.64]|uniref:alpha-L-rhamnosidase n=1 Tax=Massarina eburnea CBS 473.64 TaxID=1395130 RepID=A0A6A6SEW9_9PLEO|nr:hypothetical protein P280DRAFT_439794 [Massarina eburnea CBS 473.64]